MQPDDLKMRRAKKIVDAGALSQNSIPLAMLSEGIITNDKLDALTEAIRSIPETVIPETLIPEYPSEMVISNLPDVQKVEITNLPDEKDNKEELALLKEISQELKKKRAVRLRY